jgi:hypothetical protein
VQIVICCNIHPHFTPSAPQSPSSHKSEGPSASSGHVYKLMYVHCGFNWWTVSFKLWMLNTFISFMTLTTSHIENYFVTTLQTPIHSLVHVLFHVFVYIPGLSFKFSQHSMKYLTQQKLSLINVWRL